MAESRIGVGEGPAGPSRLLLTRVLREGAIWDVFVATIARAGAPNITQLEFERRGADRRMMRYTRPVEGPLLEALHSGAPVSRAGLEEELERAVRDAGAVAAGNVAQDVVAGAPGAAGSSGAAGDDPASGG